jgi:hypothetical protein
MLSRIRLHCDDNNSIPCGAVLCIRFSGASRWLQKAIRLHGRDSINHTTVNPARAGPSSQLIPHHLSYGCDKTSINGSPIWQFDLFQGSDKACSRFFVIDALPCFAQESIGFVIALTAFSNRSYSATSENDYAPTSRLRPKFLEPRCPWFHAFWMLPPTQRHLPQRSPAAPGCRREEAVPNQPTRLNLSGRSNVPSPIKQIPSFVTDDGRQPGPSAHHLSIS